MPGNINDDDDDDGGPGGGGGLAFNNRYAADILQAFTNTKNEFILPR